ncbi:MAG TPA: DUF1993 domain-containing protein [Polyangiaceae bacterium]
MIFESIQQMKKELVQVDKWLDLAVTYAKDKSFEPSVLLESRLAPDQFPLVRQIQISCDTLKFALGKLTGKEMPSHADEEKTVEDIKARIAKVIALVDGLTAKDFANAETITVTAPRWEGKWMIGKDYFLEHSTPNFYFHVVTTYAILRHNGVNVGKRDYLGQMSLRDPK